MAPVVKNKLLEYFLDHLLDNPQEKLPLFAITYKLFRNKCEYNFFSHFVIMVVTLINYVLGRQQWWSSWFFFLTIYHITTLSGSDKLLFFGSLNLGVFVANINFFNKQLPHTIDCNFSTNIYYTCITGFPLNSCMLPIHFTLVCRNNI